MVHVSEQTRIPSPLYARVQHTLAINRKAKLAFPCTFMGVTGCQVGNDDVLLEFEDDDTFRDGKGELSWAALGVLADRTLGTVAYMKAAPNARLATVHLEVQMTGASTQGHVVMEGHFVAFSERSGAVQSFSSAAIKSGKNLVGYASAAFVMLDLPQGKPPPPPPWLQEPIEPGPLHAIDFDCNEREALKSCERAEAAATEAFPFIEHFWGGIPEAEDGKAHLDVSVAPHLGNTVGHVHGGLLLGMAARVANAALPANMRLSNISAWFVSPGLGPRLKVLSSVVQQGRNLALVRYQIRGASGKLVLETTSQHVSAVA